MLLNMNKSYMCDGVCTIIMDTCNQIKLELMERNDPNTLIIYYPYRRRREESYGNDGYYNH